jgi:hypothetical protein
MNTLDVCLKSHWERWSGIAERRFELSAVATRLNQLRYAGLQVLSRLGAPFLIKWFLSMYEAEGTPKPGNRRNVIHHGKGVCAWRLKVKS